MNVAPRPVSITGGINGAAVRLDQVPTRANPGPGRRAGVSCCLGLAKAFEDVRQKVAEQSLRRYRARTSATSVVNAPQRHVDAAVPGRELDGVVDEIPDHLLQPIRIAP